MKEMFNEFKKFISKGNVVDLAVGIIIGASFGKIVSSLVGDIIMPLIGLIMGKVNFTSLFFAMDFQSYETLELAKKANAPILLYGNFIQSVLDFLIVGFAVFMVVKLANKAKAIADLKTAQETPIPPKIVKDCPECMSSIHIKAKICPHCQSKQVDLPS